MKLLTEQPVWPYIVQHQRQVQSMSMQGLFHNDAGRFDRFSMEAAGIFLDYSKNRITEQTMQLLQRLAQETQLTTAMDALFSADQTLNASEQRAACYPLLRAVQLSADVQSMQTAMHQFVERFERGELRGYSGEPITDIVHIGVGGSHLGPELILQSLADFKQHDINIHFLSDQDRALAKQLFRRLDPAKTIVFSVSKSFKTEETLRHTDLAIRWFLKRGDEFSKIQKQIYAITANAKRAVQYGVAADNVLEFPDWVGGRFSLWSAVGLSIACQLGWQSFQALLDGAREMDQHFMQADMAQNMPVILALLAIWYENTFGAPTKAIIPYHHQLRTLPAYLQQLHMESLGKSVDQQGRPLNYSTGRVVWGGIGPNSQHSFHQLLMQGTHLVPVDFILPLKTGCRAKPMDEVVMANCLAQSKTLMQGYAEQDIKNELMLQGAEPQVMDQMAMYRSIRGNNPSNTLLLDRLDPRGMGALLALYEHKVFVQSILWGINAFDQWGVERGKTLSRAILNQLNAKGEDESSMDASTLGLLARIKQVQEIA